MLTVSCEQATTYINAVMSPERLFIFGEPGTALLKRQLSINITEVSIALMFGLRDVFSGFNQTLKISNVIYKNKYHRSDTESLELHLVVRDMIAIITITKDLFFYYVPYYDTRQELSIKHENAEIVSVLNEVFKIQNEELQQRVSDLDVKDHVIRELVNDVTKVAKIFHDSDSLRDRMSEAVQERLNPSFKV